MNKTLNKMELFQLLKISNMDIILILYEGLILYMYDYVSMNEISNFLTFVIVILREKNI